MSIDEIHFQVGPYHLYGHASCGKKGIGNCMPAYSDYSSITAIDRMGNKPFSLFVKGNGNVLVFVDNFRMILSHYKGKRCFFFIDNAWVHNRDDLKYLCHETNQIILFNAPNTPDFNPIEMYFCGVEEESVQASSSSSFTRSINLDLKRYLLGY